MPVLGVLGLVALASLASPCAAFVPALGQPRLLGGCSRAVAALHGRARHPRMSSAPPQDGGRVPPKPLAKYTTEPVGSNLPKADSAK